MESSKCAVCGVAATQRCTGCRQVFYCSRDHQKQNWRTHRSDCRPFKVEENKSLGRYVVATRKMSPHELLLRESPLVRGPLMETPPVCLGCYKLLTADCVTCVRCGWPMCSPSCADSPDHLAECTITTKVRGEKVNIDDFGEEHGMYKYIVILRALYLREADPKRWQKLLALESHLNLRRKNFEYMLDGAILVQQISNIFKLRSFSEEDLLRVYGILQVNSYKVLLPNPGHMAVYELASMLEHSCAPNCGGIPNEAAVMIMRAAKSIEPGEHLSISYVDSLWCRMRRQNFLHESKFFWCRCPRCSDPTEMGTYFSALRCPKMGCDGLCVPNAEWLKREPAAGEEEPDWLCEQCKQSLPFAQVKQWLEMAASDFASVDNEDPFQCAEFIRRQESARQLSPQHAYITKAQLSVAQRLGLYTVGGFEKLTDEQLALKEKLCRSLCQLFSKLCPDQFLTRGLLLVCLHETLLAKSLRRPVEMLFGSSTYPQVLQESRKLLLEALELLRDAPDGSFEKQSMQTAETYIKVVDKEMQRLGNRPPSSR